MRLLKPFVAAAAATALVALGTATPAQAATKLCTVDFDGDCTSGSVRAYNGWVTITGVGYNYLTTYYQVRDVNNWEIINSGSFGPVFSKTLRNVHSSYRVELYNSPLGASATITAN